MILTDKRNFFVRSRRLVAAAGLLVLTLGTSVGVLTNTTSWASGVSVGSDAQALATGEVYNYPIAFDLSIQKALDELRSADPNASDSITRFYDTYTTATQDYGTALLSASQIYSETSDSNPSAAKNAYVDNFSRARADYFNTLEEARNSVVIELSGTNDVAKDMFVNEYNAARDIYNNQLESVKNEIASLDS